MEKIKLPSLNLGSDLKSLEDEALASFKEDPELYHIIHDELELTAKEVKSHLGTLLDVQEDLAVCRECPGLDHCPKAHPCFCVHLDYVEGQLERTYMPCQKKIDRDEMIGRFFLRDFPIEWMEMDFSKIDLTESRKKFLLAVRDALKNENPRWIYVNGGHRQGKSFMLSLAAKEYGEKHRKVGFANTAKLIETLKDKSIKDKSRFENMMRILSSCPLLVLDEFGNEYKSEFVFSSILYPLLSERAKNNLPTWFSSDFSIDEIVDMYKGKIGFARAKQFQRLLEDHCKQEIAIEGVSVY